MTEPEIYTFLTGVFEEIFMREPMTLTPELTANDVEGWDSFKQIEIIVAIQEGLGIKFATKELDNLQCVGDLAKLIAAKKQ